MYHPIASDTGNKTVEGGSLDAFGKKIVTATDVEERRARGDSSAGSIDHPITLAGDPSHYGEIYLIPSLSFTTVNPDGTTQSHTVTNVYGKVTDTGSAFTGKPHKIDIATSHVPNQAIANREDRLPNNTGSLDMIPANEKAERFASGQGTQPTTVQQNQTLFTQNVVGKLLNTVVSGSSTFFPVWVSFPLCYKKTGPAFKGFSAFAPTCNGGTIIIPPSTVPVFVPDCGPFNVGCTPPLGVPLGCLNAVCARNANAIYDPITKKCGCG